MLNSIRHITSALAGRVSPEDGQTMVEYALLVAFIAIIVLVGVQLLGTNLLALFNSFATQI
jgi:pilus assembly protein Flp/PilA